MRVGPPWRRNLWNFNSRCDSSRISACNIKTTVASHRDAAGCARDCHGHGWSTSTAETRSCRQTVHTEPEQPWQHAKLHAPLRLLFRWLIMQKKRRRSRYVVFGLPIDCCLDLTKLRRENRQTMISQKLLPNDVHTARVGLLGTGTRPQRKNCHQR